VKIIEADGTEMGDAETILLEERIFSQNFDTADWQRVGREVAAPAMVDEYIDAVVAAFPPGIGNGMTVIADPGCGAAAVTTPRILSRLGCRVMTINSQIDGTFPGRLPEPSVEGLKGLTDLVRSSGAAFGVAHDGDADRAVFIDETGRYIEENQEFGLIEQEVCSSRTGAVVTPVSSSRLIEAIAEKNGCHVVYTPVGSIYVARTMIGLLEKGEAVAFGGEGNGGLIYPDHQFCRDGGMTAAMMVAILSRTGKPLSTLVENLPVFFMIKDKVRVKDPEALIMQMKQAFASDRLDLTDGVRINRGDTWALIRPSGTEPLVRVMVESGRKEAANAFYQEIIRQIKS
jgi:phosphomannomutase/phosphoglucomutase